MSENNLFFIQEALNIGAYNITFHIETSIHVQKYIDLIKSKNVQVGIALNPATSLNTLEYLYGQVDNITIMAINPGFAGDSNERPISYAMGKIKNLAKIRDKYNYKFNIQVDGRVSIERIAKLVQCGADNLVLGSTSLFRKGLSLEENKVAILEEIKKGVK